MSRAFAEGARLAKLTEEEVEQIWRAALSPEAGAAFQGRRDAERARASAWSTLQKANCLWAVFGTPDHNDMGTGKWLIDACRLYCYARLLNSVLMLARRRQRPPGRKQSQCQRNTGTVPDLDASQSTLCQYPPVAGQALASSLVTVNSRSYQAHASGNEAVACLLQYQVARVSLPAAAVFQCHGCCANDQRRRCQCAGLLWAC